MLIYLRQEGRGIGLGRQAQGVQPTGRGHETPMKPIPQWAMVKMKGNTPMPLGFWTIMAFKDVRLLTNNPLKEQALKHAGVNVVERLPRARNRDVRQCGLLEGQKRNYGPLALITTPASCPNVTRDSERCWCVP